MIDVNLSWTRLKLLHAADNVLASNNINDSLRNAEWMICDLLKCNRAQLYAYSDTLVPPEIIHSLNQQLERRIKHEPIQYILGYTIFFGLRINLSPGVLIPRPETELLVERALNKIAAINNPSILDIGTGSGCIALAIKHARPDATVHACDISRVALQVARENAQTLGLDINLFYCDIQSGMPSNKAMKDLDLILSNPPYIPDEERSSMDIEVKEFEPNIALFVQQDPLYFYRIIAAVGKKMLKKNGAIFFETHSDYATDVYHLLSESSFENVELTPDLAGKPRIVHGEK